VKKQWYIVDATDKRLGRLASTVAIHIRGKNMPTYTPSTDMGAYVIIVCFYSVTIALVLFYNTQPVDIANRFCQSFSN
jgi:large subunit ribosomal protein L13